jgi:hypothetical protein
VEIRRRCALARVITGQLRLPAATRDRDVRAAFQPVISVLLAGHDLGRVLRVQAKPLRGRFESLDT